MSGRVDPPDADEDADLARRAVEADAVVVAALRCAERCAELHAGVRQLVEALRELVAAVDDAGPGAMWTMVGDREQHIRAVLAEWERT